MTKKKLLLVSLFLVFGLVTMAATSLAQTQWTVGAAARANGRSEGLTEATGVVSLNNYTSGTVIAGSYFTITYSAPVVPGTAFVQCSGSSTSPFFGTQPSCVGFLAITYPTATTVRLTWIPTATVFSAALNSSINLTVRVDATGVSCASGVNEYVAAQGGSTTFGMSITPIQPSFPSTILSMGVNKAGTCDPALSLTLGTEKGKLETGPAYALTCIGAKELGPFDNDFTLNVDEEFPYALTSESYEMALNPGYADPGYVTNGTSVDITLYNVPQNVGIKETDIKPCSTLWTGNPLSCPGGTLDIEADDAQPVCTDDAGSSPPTQTCNFTFETTMVDAGTAESVDIKFKFWSKGPVPPGSLCITANLAKDPTTPATAVPLFKAEMELKTPLSVVCFADCKTVLLYPYLVDDFGYGSGIAVSNTTMDPFVGDPVYGKGSAVPQSGPCTFYLYGTPPGATYPSAPLTATFTSPTIGTGQTYAFDMSAKLMGGVAGYVIGVCDFQNAHGYALITFHLMGTDGIAANYLADVLPNPALYHRTPAGDMLGETAIAPYEIPRELERLLNFGGGMR